MGKARTVDGASLGSTLSIEAHICYTQEPPATYPGHFDITTALKVMVVVTTRHYNGHRSVFVRAQLADERLRSVICGLS